MRLLRVAVFGDPRRRRRRAGGRTRGVRRLRAGNPELRVARRLPAEARHDRLRPVRPDDRRVLPRAPGGPFVRRNPTEARPGGAGLRGRPLLRARRHRLLGHRSRRVGEPESGACRPGWVDDHPAGRQVADHLRGGLQGRVRQEALAQDQGGDPRAQAREEAVQARHPHAVPEPDLPREPGLRRAVRLGVLLPEGRPGAERRRDGAHGGPATGAVALLPLPPPEARQGAPRVRAPAHARRGLHHGDRADRGEGDADRRVPRPERVPRGDAVLHGAGPPRALRALRREDRPRGRPPRLDDGRRRALPRGGGLRLRQPAHGRQTPGLPRRARPAEGAGEAGALHRRLQRGADAPRPLREARERRALRGDGQRRSTARTTTSTP